MRRFAPLCLVLASTGLLGGCTGTGVFFDHTFQWFGRNPNAAAGSSETFLRMRGVPVDVPPIMPSQGNIWPTNTGPDLTLQDVEQQQNDEIRRNGGQPPAAGAAGGPGAGPTNGPNPQINRANNADRGLPPPAPAPRPPGRRSEVPTPGGPSVDVGGGTGRGYRDLQGPSSTNTTTSNGGILVPNGNGTSTLISPDGSIKTVPTR
jgi:hypothetical protein